MTPEADKALNDWHKATATKPNTSDDPRLDGYYARKEAHTVKTAMLVAASHGDERIITLDYLKESWRLLAEVELAMSSVFANVGKNPLALDYTDVMRAISTQPGIKFATLMIMFKHSVRKTELQEILDTHVAGNVISANAGATYYPVFKKPEGQ